MLEFCPELGRNRGGVAIHGLGGLLRAGDAGDHARDSRMAEHELQRRSAGQDLASVYRLEYITALHCAAHGDFAEGIRALLIDKDRTPHWQPQTLAEATVGWADTFFASPWTAATHPLADLGATVPERSYA